MLRYWLPSTTSVSARARRRYGVDATTGDGTVALTFDDGPHPEGTPAVLELLAREGVHATFFLAGEQVERLPGLAGEIAAAGHTVGVHCHRHRNLLRLPPREVRVDLERAAAVVQESAGVAPRVYRPPYGILTAAALAEAHTRAWRTVLWSRDGRDWRRRATSRSIAERIGRALRAGDIVLLHDSDAYSAPGSWRRTVAALPELLELALARELRLEPL